MEAKNAIKSFQMGLIIFITQTGVGVIMLPSALAKDVGHDGWISLVLTGLIVILLSILIVILLKRYSDKGIYDINRLIFGKITGTLLNALLVLYLLTASVAGASLFNYFIRITVLQETPPWVLAPFITLPTFYLVWQGLKNISRFLFCSVVCYIAIVILIPLMYKEFKLSFLFPIGEAGITPIILSFKTSFFAYLGFELMAFFYPYISNKNKVLKWYITANLLSMILFILVVNASTALFGENLLRSLTLPFFNLSRVYNAPIFERIDLYIIALWFIPIACSMRSYVFAAFDGLQKVFKMKKSRLWYTVFFVSIFVLSSIPKDFGQVLQLIEIINAAGMGITAFLVLCLFLSFIRRKGVKVK